MLQMLQNGHWHRLLRIRRLAETKIRFGGRKKCDTGPETSGNNLPNSIVRVSCCYFCYLLLSTLTHKNCHRCRKIYSTSKTVYSQSNLRGLRVLFQIEPLTPLKSKTSFQRNCCCLSIVEIYFFTDRLRPYTISMTNLYIYITISTRHTFIKNECL